MAEKNSRPLTQQDIDAASALLPYIKQASVYPKLAEQLPVKTKSTQSLKDLLSKVGTIQTNKTLLEILGQTEKPAVRKGIVSTLLDPEKGILFTPARAGSAFVADLLGLAQEADGSVLQEYNPFEAALRSARGEFAITGGDVIPTQDDDSILERSAKLGGAFVWDVLTDPTSYIGGASGTFSRKALVESAANPDVMLNVLDKVRLAAGKNGLSVSYADDLVEKLAQMNTRFVDNELAFVDDVVEVAGEAATTRRVAKRVTTGEVIDQEEVKRLAADSLSNVVSNGLLRRGRAGIFSNLYNVMIDEAQSPAVQKLIKDTFEIYMPRELAGGLYIINPLTGKRYQRIAGGHGTSNPVKEAVNKARFEGARFNAKFISKEISGEYGPAWSAVMDSLRPGRGATDSITTVTDYLNFRSQMRRKGEYVKEASNAAVNATKNIVKAREEIVARGGEEVAKESFDNNLAQFVWDAGNYTVDDIERIAARSTVDMTAAEYAAHTAQVHAIEIRKMFLDYATQMKDLGIEIGMLDNFVPLMFTKEALQYLRKFEPRIGVDLRDFYSGELKRTTFEILDDVGLLKELLEEVETPTRLFASPQEANRRARDLFGVENFFETDMTNLIARYANWASGRIATERISQNLQKLGTITKVNDVVVSTVNAHNAAAYLEGARTVSNATRTRLQKIVDDAEAQLKELADEDAVTAEKRRRRGARTAANNRLRAAVRRETDIRSELTTVNRQLRDNPVVKSNKLASLLKRTVLNKNQREAIVVIDSAAATVRKSRAAIRRTDKQAAKQYDTIKSIEQEIKKLETQAARAKTDKTRLLKEEQIADAEFRLQEATDNLDYFDELVEAEHDYIASMKEFQESWKKYADEHLDEQAKYIVDEEFKGTIELIEKRNELNKALADAKAARKELRDQVKVLKLDSLKLNSAAIQSALDAYLTASDNLRQFERVLFAKDPDLITDAEKATRQLLIDANKAARKTFQKTIGWTAKRKTSRQTAGREWARKIYDLTKDLNNAQRQLVQIMSSPQMIDDFIRRWYDVPMTHAEKIEILNDFMYSYKSLRQFVTEKDLEELTELQRVLLDPTGRQKERVTDTFTEKYTARVTQVRDDIDALERKLNRDDLNDEGRARIEEKLSELKTDLNRINFFADNNTLVGAGKSVSLPKAFHNIYASDGVRTVIERMYWVRQDPTDFQRYVRELYDPLSFLWKTQATVGRGWAYVWNNIIGGTLNNYTHGVTIQDHVQSAKLQRAFNDSVEAVKKANGEKVLTSAELTDAVADEFKKRIADVKIVATDKEVLDTFAIMERFFKSPAWFSTHTGITLDDLAEQFGRQVEVKPLLEESDKLGVSFKWQTEARTKSEERFRRFVSFMLTNPVQAHFNDMAQQSEVFLRLAAYLRGFKQFKNHESALNIVYMLHFDYRDLSAFEQNIKRFVPFYTWNRYNIPLQLRALFFQQDKIKNIVRLNENAKAAFGMDEEDTWISELMPEWFDKQGGWLTRYGFDGLPIGFFPKMPIYDVDKILQVHTIGDYPIPVLVTPRLQELGQMLGPATTPLEYISNVNWDTGIPYTSEKDKFFRMLTNLAPIVGTSRRLANAATIPLSLGGVEWNVPLLDESRNVSDALNLFIGSPYGAVTVTERTLTSGAINRIEAQAAQIAQAAAAANIDVDWLRQQIRKGLTIAQIKKLIAAGYGKANLLAQKREIQAMQREAPRDYMQVITGLRGGNPSLTGY